MRGCIVRAMGWISIRAARTFARTKGKVGLRRTAGRTPNFEKHQNLLLARRRSADRHRVQLLVESREDRSELLVRPEFRRADLLQADGVPVRSVGRTRRAPRDGLRDRLDVL